jgi:hypothetical protein
MAATKADRLKAFGEAHIKSGAPMSEWREQELFKAMMILPVEGLKIISWINGGAAVAVLTYVGNLSSKTPGGHLPI